MGVHNAELFTNLGLCCFYAQQFDMSLYCFQKAVELASDDNQDDVWYNIGHVALVR
jgi:tetratricopeptide repeat protein 8